MKRLLKLDLSRLDHCEISKKCVDESQELLNELGSYKNYKYAIHKRRKLMSIIELNRNNLLISIDSIKGITTQEQIPFEDLVDYTLYYFDYFGSICKIMVSGDEIQGVFPYHQNYTRNFLDVIYSNQKVLL